MGETSKIDMERWCRQHHLRWEALTPFQADRAKEISCAPMALLPEGLRGGLVRWIVKGIPTGGFLAAVLRNDLAEACARIDHENRPFLPDVVKWLYNYAPGPCWRTPERVAAWPAIASPPAPGKDLCTAHATQWRAWQQRRAGR